MKNKKGFTLVELLAIIVILAIIAVITVPTILNIIENSKRGAAINSAYGYKDAVEKFYVSKLLVDPNYSIPDGLHTQQDFNIMGVKVSGKQPALNSFLKTQNNMVTQGCLQFDEYRVNFVDGKPQNAEKGECKTVSLVYTDVDNSGTINLGDTVKIENDEFYIIAAPSDGKVKLLAKYNLNSESRQASSDALTVNFGAHEYWKNNLSNYPMDIYDTYYVYSRNMNNNLYSYFENYKDYLVNLGAYFVTDSRAMSFDEAKNMGCKTHTESDYKESCPTFAYNQSYWLGSSSSSNWIYYINGGAKNGYLYSNTNNATWGVRPLIEINESAITSEYIITFDSRGGTEVESMSIIPGTSIGTLPANPTKEGAIFEGWYTDKEYTSDKLTSDTVPVGSTKYYARYVLSKAEYIDSNDSGTIDLGDSVRILDDEFYVIASPSNGKVKLLPKYNLNTSSRQEGGHNPNVSFSSSRYWSDSLFDYQMDVYDNYYVYRNKNNQDTSNNLADYINNYKTYLTRQGAEFVTDIRLMSFEEAKNMGCKTHTESDYKESCPTFAYNQSYWLGSSSPSNWIYYINGGAKNGYLYSNTNNATWGVRPLIEINESAL